MGEQLVVVRAPRDARVTPLLDRWGAQLLRGGVHRRGVVRTPLDAGRAVVALVAAAGVWWFSTVREPLGWQLTWQWVLLLLALLAALGLVGAAVLVAVLAARSRRWGPALAAAVAALAGAALLVAAVRGATVWTGACWVLAVAGAAAVWPAVLAAVRRSLLIGVVAAVVLVLGETTISLVDVIALAALGYAAGCVCRLVVGRDVDEVSAEEAAMYAAALGVDVSHATAMKQSRVGDRFRAQAGVGDVEVTVYGRSAVDAQLLTRVLKVLWYRNARLPVPLTRLQHLEHHVALTAQGTSRGVSTAVVVAAGLAGPAEDAVVITRQRPARPLAELDPGALRADELAAVWSTVVAMGDAGIVHRRLDLDALALDGQQCVVLDLPGGSLIGSGNDVTSDRAACLVATSRMVGAEAAVAAAREALGTQGLAAVVPLLQTAALPRSLRTPRRSKELAELRSLASTAAGVEQVELAGVHRVKASSLLMAAGTLLGLWLLIGELTGYADVLSGLLGANWWWMVPAFVVGLLPNLTEAVALSGAVAAPLRYWPLVMLRLADGFFGLVGGTVATTAAAVRFFQKEGLGASIAVSSGVLYSLAGFADQVVLSAIALCFAWGAFSLSTARAGSSGASGSGGGDAGDILLLLLVGLVVVGAVVGVLLVRPRFRRSVMVKVRPQATIVRDNLRELAGQPGKLRRLFGANVATQILFAACLGLCLHAYGGHATIAVLILVNTGASLLGGLAPVPGGMGVMEGAIITGLLAAGVPQEQAILATFSYRLITAYLPPVWGWGALVWLRRHDHL